MRRVLLLAAIAFAVVATIVIEGVLIFFALYSSVYGTESQTEALFLASLIFPCFAAAAGGTVAFLYDFLSE
jgi:hypothetical protein